MLNVEDIRGHWSTIQGKLKEKWGQLTDDDLQIIGGNIDQIIGRIQQKVGAERRAVEEFLEKAATAAPSLRDLQQAAGEKARQAADSARQGLGRASQRMQTGLENAEEVVRQRPAESVATTFLAGVLAGLFVAMILRSNR